MFIEQDNSTALHSASTNGHHDVVRILLSSKANVNTQSKVSHRSVSSHVSMYNYFHGILSCCTQFYSVCNCVQKGVTPLLMASSRGRQKCAELLIEAGADVDMPDKVRLTCYTHFNVHFDSQWYIKVQPVGPRLLVVGWGHFYMIMHCKI